MTKEEKLELINKIGTQIDGAESYLVKLKDDEHEISVGCIMRHITVLRTMLQSMEDVIKGEA